MARERERREERRLSHETGHVDINRIPQDQEIVLFERECLDTKVFSDKIARHNTIYNQSVSLDWHEADPKEDYNPKP